MTPEPEEGSEGRKKRGKWARAAQSAREAARYAAAFGRLTRDLVELIGFIDRHF